MNASGISSYPILSRNSRRFGKTKSRSRAATDNPSDVTASKATLTPFGSVVFERPTMRSRVPVGTHRLRFSALVRTGTPIRPAIPKTVQFAASSIAVYKMPEWRRPGHPSIVTSARSSVSTRLPTRRNASCNPRGLRGPQPKQGFVSSFSKTTTGSTSVIDLPHRTQVENSYKASVVGSAYLMAHGRFGASMLKFETVAVVVRDEKKATKFWKEKVGFRVVTSFPHWVTVAPRGANVRLHLCPDARPEKGNTGFLFSTKDAKQEEARLRKNGVKISQSVKKEEWGTTLRFLDPDGNEFQVIQD